MNTKPLNLVIISATALLLLSACNQAPVSTPTPAQTANKTSTQTPANIIPNQESTKELAAEANSKPLDCPWENFADSEKIGLKMQVQKCPDGSYYTIDASGVISYYDLVTSPKKANLQLKIVELFEKKPTESMELTIKSQFLDILPDTNAKENCSVIKTTKNDQTIYTIEPSKEYAQKLEQNHITVPACGPFGTTTSISQYFLQPKSDSNKFIIERIGPEGALFKDLEIITPTAKSIPAPIFVKTPRKK